MDTRAEYRSGAKAERWKEHQESAKRLGKRDAAENGGRIGTTR